MIVLKAIARRAQLVSGSYLIGCGLAGEPMSKWVWACALLGSGWSCVDRRGAIGSWHRQVAIMECPYGVPGDLAWVREAHSIGPGPHVALFNGENGGALRFPHVTYTADGAVERRDTRWSGVFGKRRPSIHMPRWASRITLQVTDVRVERLQDISVDDAKAEGLKCLSKDGGRLFKYGIPDSDGEPGEDDHGWPWHLWRISPVDAYEALWESINGPGSWDANPWIWCVSFRRLP